MTQDEKEVFDCMQDEDGDYEELEDDFLLMANEGKPALQEDEKDEEKGQEENEDQEYENKDVYIIEKDEEEKEAEERLKEMREAMA